MPHETNQSDPDDTSVDMDLIEENDEPELEDDDENVESDESFVWDAAPEGTQSSEATRGGTRTGSMAGAQIEAGGIDRRAADELGLGWMDDDDLAGAGTSLRGFGEDEILLIKKQRSAEVRKQLTSVGGQFVMGLLVGLVTVAAIILGATNWTNNAYLIPSAVITPIGLWYTFTRWKRWIGTAPYFYRLMSSLGEDAENLKFDHAKKQMRKANKQISKYSNR